jgi:hypothetical protein
MNCFRHAEVTSVGVCRACGKGVCSVCASESKGVLACRATCETRAAHLEEMNDRALRIYGIGANKSSGVNTGVMLWSLLAAASWLPVIVTLNSERTISPVLLGFALIMTLALAIVYRGYRRTRLNC